MKKSAGIKRLLLNILSFSVKPITSQSAYFLLLYMLLNVLDIYSIAVIHSQSPCLKLASGFLLCYILSFPVVILSSLLRKLYKVLVLLYSLVLFSVDVYLIALYNETFRTLSPDVIAAMLVTNPAEAGEYLTTYLTAGKMVMVLSAILLLSGVFYFLRKVQFIWTDVSKCVLFFLLLLSGFTCVSRFSWSVFGNFYLLATRNCPDLNEYRQNPIVSVKDNAPANIVFIIGESFAKDHSSLYGYEKPTNPLLVSMKDDGKLLIYNNVTSACLTTIPAIKSLMSGYVKEQPGDCEWYERLTLLEVMQNAGYKTYWVSTPFKYGIHENEVGRYADLCDSQNFLNDSKDSEDILKDENLISALDVFIEETAEYKFYIVHMMGSHFTYADRYHKEFSKFKLEDYAVSHTHLSNENRKILSEYDNSILYNDFVVYGMMSKFEDTDALVIYLSDHGQDVFDSSDDYAGHPTPGNEISVRVGTEIPFMVYTTPLFRQRHPQLQERIERSVSTPYRTDSIMYTIMDVAGIETVNGISYKHKSLFK